METKFQELFDFATPAECAQAINSMFQSNAALMATLVRQNNGHLIEIDHLPTPENITVLRRLAEAFQPLK